jgi:sulfite reductase (NADPH) flavoprotein alpha-component
VSDTLAQSADARRETGLVPVIPEHAPFTSEQRAWLNGFLAGLFSRGSVASASLGDRTATTPLRSLMILFGSQTGNAEALARRAAKVAGQRGFAPTVCEMAQYNCGGLAQEQNLLVITSTYGDGEPPDNAKVFADFLLGEQAPVLEQLRFSVCALGDTNYEKFCQCGKDFDRRLEELKARRVFPRADCDVEFEEPFMKWLDSALSALRECDGGEAPSLVAGFSDTAARPAISPVGADESARLRNGAPVGESPWSRSNPFPARLITNRILNGPGSAKETRHFEIALGESSLTYEAGDALGVMPANCPDLVEEIICALGCDGEAAVPNPDGAEVPLRVALSRHYDLTRIQKAFLDCMAERSGDAELWQLTQPAANGALDRFLRGREVIDLLLAYPHARIAACEFVGLLRKLQPRLYSISSSPKVHVGQVHLTVGVVRYETNGRSRKGVCSTFLADRVQGETPVPIFIQTNKSFRLPVDATRPVIMVGPGTGVAPFRAFLHERKITGAPGRNWLFFGDQRAQCDFLYREELETMLRDGVLTHLHTAFSRDQERKIYVQHRLLEHARELYTWLEEGAHFYVCGDATRMAKDVDAALHRVIEIGGGRTPEQAAEYVRQLKAEKRCQRDVY